MLAGFLIITFKASSCITSRFLFFAKFNLVDNFTSKMKKITQETRKFESRVDKVASKVGKNNIKKAADKITD